MTDQINELPEDKLKSSPETSRYTENKWISRKNQNKLYFFTPSVSKNHFSSNISESKLNLNVQISKNKKKKEKRIGTNL